jgi:hypothetical protein
MAPYLERHHSSRILNSLATAITSGTVSQAPAVFGQQTRQIRVSSTLPTWIKYGDGAQTAAAGDTWLPANVVDYFTVTPGQTFAFLSTSTSSGYVSITEMA